MLKIIATITNFGAAANVGGEVERTSFEIEIPENYLPEEVKNHLQKENHRTWQNISLSIKSDSFKND
jgi:hypothetical protein